jgi:hypothetical protein
MLTTDLFYFIPPANVLQNTMFTSRRISLWIAITKSIPAFGVHNAISFIRVNGVRVLGRYFFVWSADIS